MMSRTQVTLDRELHRRGRARAAELGISFAEYVRRLVQADLGGKQRSVRISSVFDLGRSHGSNVADNKDRYLGEAIEAEAASERRRR